MVLSRGGPSAGRELSGLPVGGLLALLVIYVVWGSTYLAIRVAVREGAGWGPFWLGAARVLVAAAVLFAFNRLRGVRLRPTRAELGVLVVTGVLLWVGGNGAVNWAEQRIDSGLAALVVGTMPMWVAAMEAAIDRRAPTLRLAGSLVIGFAGLSVLTYPMLRGGFTADVIGVLVVVIAAVSWGYGSILTIGGGWRSIRSSCPAGSSSQAGSASLRWRSPHGSRCRGRRPRPGLVGPTWWSSAP